MAAGNRQDQAGGTSLGELFPKWGAQEAMGAKERHSTVWEAEEASRRKLIYGSVKAGTGFRWDS